MSNEEELSGALLAYEYLGHDKGILAEKICTR